MKKAVLFLTLILNIFMLSGCTKNNNYTLPDLSGKTLVEAIASVNSEITLNPVYVPSNGTLPGYVISYGSSLEPLDTVKKGSSVNILVATEPDNAFSYSNDIMYVSTISQLTGTASIQNGTLLEEAGVVGTDLGIPVDIGDEVILLFGDSYSGSNMSGFWNSNFIAETTDTNFSDGLSFTSLVTASSGMVKPFAQGLHQSGSETDITREVTKIPTGGIKIGDYVYVFYMSVRYWGVAGTWLVSYNQCIRSTDLVNWENVTSLRWDEDEAYNFGQIYPFKDPNSSYIYLYGIPGGREGGCVVARVTEDNFENRDEYEYEVADNVWVKGDEGLLSLKNNPYYVISPSVSELSFMYNEYLGKYITVFYKNSKIIMMSSLTPYGKFSDSTTLLTSSEYSGLYGGFINPKFTSDNGQSIYLTVSCWAVYNVFWIKVVFS